MWYRHVNALPLLRVKFFFIYGHWLSTIEYWYVHVKFVTFDWPEHAMNRNNYFHFLRSWRNNHLNHFSFPTIYSTRLEEKLYVFFIARENHQIGFVKISSNFFKFSSAILEKSLLFQSSKKNSNLIWIKIEYQRISRSELNIKETLNLANKIVFFFYFLKINLHSFACVHAPSMLSIEYDL